MVHLLGDFAYTWPYCAALVASYILGSIPFGLILTRAAGLGDIRAIGSGNIGATNVLRTGRKGLALATLLLDAAKGAVAVLIARHWGPDMAVIAGGGAVIGHLFPIWLRFKGGKGVATTLGMLLALAPVVGLAACAIWLLVAWISRYSSAASLAATGLAPVLAYVFADHQKAQLLLMIAILVWWRHRQNIGRLLRGRETRIGSGRAPDPS
jgi:acyl phosphate:glycerol-3-phosphate acyltransferase